MAERDCLDALLDSLGYRGRPGYFPVSQFGALPRHQHLLREAVHKLGIAGVFGLRGDGQNLHTFVPLVYVARADDLERARQIHRGVWSQGFVPFLLISTDSGVFSCSGLAYDSKTWDECAVTFVERSKLSPDSAPDELKSLSARALRTSLVWNDREFGFDGRVDMRLLDNLEALSRVLIQGQLAAPLLPPTANAIVGRFLYLRLLRERGILPDDWSLVTPLALWEAFSRLERIFNGSIFPLAPAQRRALKDGHLELLSHVLLDDGDMMDGGVQTSFRDFRFSAIRTETLSAVYELFLETTSKSGKAKEGAFYTPPFLVDYLLSRVESSGPLKPGMTVLDCAAGSGIFLVAAFRRIVETELRKRDITQLPLAELHRLVQRSVWGIERNSDACHVAAFSLYLTILDYVEPTDLADAIASGGARKVFPSLVGRNIECRDFFEFSTSSESPGRFDIVLTNPPWQKAKTLGGAIVRYMDGAANTVTDSDRAAPLFFWKAIKDHLKPGGRFGCVMSGRALLTPSAKRFPTALLQDVVVTEIANLSHMRRKLFPRAEHPAVLVVGNGGPMPSARIRVFRPRLSSQPLARDNTPWTIIEDSADVEEFWASRIRSPSDLIEVLTLPLVDRQLANYLRDLESSGRATTMGAVLRKHNLEIKRGGTATETGIAERFLLGSNPKSPDYYRVRLGLDPGDAHDYGLPISMIRHARGEYSRAFAGSIVAMPRSMTHVDYITVPFAFRSSINAIFSRSGDPNVTGLLRAITGYLRSGFARYCFSLFGKTWSLDERRLEQKELRLLPMPLDFLDVRHAGIFASQLEEKGDTILHQRFGLSDGFRRAAHEFTAFRSGFQNGQVPAKAREAASDQDFAVYTSVFRKELQTYFGTTLDAKAVVARFEARNVAVVSVQSGTTLDMDEAGPALNEFDRQGADVFHASSWRYFGGSDLPIRIVKPLARLHWTAERAFADAQHLVAQFLRP